MLKSTERRAAAQAGRTPSPRRSARGPQSLLRLQLDNLKRAADRLKGPNRHVLLRAVDDAERRLAAS